MLPAKRRIVPAKYMIFLEQFIHLEVQIQSYPSAVQSDFNLVGFD